ncbi:MAG: AbrB/MazE/SpoVT family DNA-binding domain-containing protein [Candidatus Micrarchaeaceae archaeon]
MEIERTISEKGQIVIPKDVRDYLGLKEGSEIIFEIKENEIVLRPRAGPKEFVEKFLNTSKKVRKLDMNRIKKVIEDEY